LYREHRFTIRWEVQLPGRDLKTQHIRARARARARARMNVHRKRIAINDEASARFRGSFAMNCGSLQNQIEFQQFSRAF